MPNISDCGSTLPLFLPPAITKLCEPKRIAKPTKKKGKRRAVNVEFRAFPSQCKLSGDEVCTARDDQTEEVLCVKAKVMLWRSVRTQDYNTVPRVSTSVPCCSWLMWFRLASFFQFYFRSCLPSLFVLFIGYWNRRQKYCPQNRSPIGTIQ